MVGFSILLFFAVTGITLNHQDMLTGEARSTRFVGAVNTAWLNPPAGHDVSKLEIVEQLRNEHGIKAALSDFRVDDDQVSVSFKGPGYAADAFVDRKSGKYELNVTRLGFVAVINDLHKGRDTGTAWSKVIDISAGLMTLVSVTGLILIFFLQKRLATGLVSLTIGTILCLAVYLIWVS
jgi:hypothetical protein